MNAVVIEALRTPIGKASPDKGYFRDTRADDLSASLLRALVDRTGIDPALLEDVLGDPPAPAPPPPSPTPLVRH